MPHFNLRYFLETLGKHRKDDVFVLQIGAMDGSTFDPVHEYISNFNWGGVLVEPLPEHFAKLKETYKSNDKLRFVNTAIAEHDGTVTLHRVSDEAVANGDVPKWGYGLASIYKDRNALAFDDVQGFVFEQEVPAIRLESLLKQQNINNIDVLQIDVEGYDYNIIKQLNFNTHAPMVINMEIINLPKAEKTACKRLLDSFGYIHIKAGYDLLAVSPEFFRQYV